MMLFTKQYLLRKNKRSGAGFKLTSTILLLNLLCNLLIEARSSLQGETVVCEKMHLMREKIINTETSIDLQIPLKLSGNATCFSPAENLFFVSLLSAQNMLGPNAPWYKKLSDESRDKSRQACIILGYDQNNTVKNLDECVQEHFTELMQPYKNQYMQESYTYIKKRNAQAHVLIQKCKTAFFRSLPNLPDNIYFPLAYYDNKIHSYPDWYVKKRIHDIPWLQNVNNIKASDIVTENIGDACPGEMIWWLYLDKQ